MGGRVGGWGGGGGVVGWTLVEGGWIGVQHGWITWGQGCTH